MTRLITEIVCRRAFTARVAVLVCLAVALTVGSTGVCVAAGPYGGTVRDLGMDPRTGDPLWSATNRGLFRFFENRWVREKGLGTTPLSAVLDTGERIFVAAEHKGLLFSDSMGLTWEPMTQGLQNRYGHPVDDISQIAVDTKSPTILYLATAGKGLFVSRNGGLAWETMDAGLEKFNNAAKHVLTVLPSDGMRPLLIGTEGAGLLKYVGEHWKAAGEGLPEKLKINQLVADPNNPEHIAMATRFNGLWESNDAGSTWTLLRKGPFGVASCVAIGQDSSVLAFFAQEGLVSARDGKARRPTSFGNNVIMQLRPRSPEGWFAALADDGVVELDGDAKVVRVIDKGMDATRIKAFIQGKRSKALLAGDHNGVFYSAKGKNSWIKRDAGMQMAPVSSFALQGDSLYAGTEGSGVFLWSEEEGKWLDRGRAMGTANTVSSLVAAPDGNLYAGTEGGVLSTGDGGMGWARVNSGLPHSSRWSLAFDPKKKGVLWAAAKGGLFATRNSGESWTRVGSKPLEEALHSQGKLWLRSRGKVETLVGGESQTVYEARQGEALYSFLPTKFGLWVGTSDGLWLVKDGKKEQLWEGVGVTALLVGNKNNRLYVGTDGRGVKVFRLQ